MTENSNKNTYISLHKNFVRENIEIGRAHV